MSDNDRLDSWKEIANYINRKVRTCQRWEKGLGLPVYRINDKSTHSKVFAYKKEIEQWFKERAKKQRSEKGSLFNKQLNKN